MVKMLMKLLLKFGLEKCGFVCYNADESEAGIELMKRMSIINVINTILILWLQVGPHC